MILVLKHYNTLLCNAAMLVEPLFDGFSAASSLAFSYTSFPTCYNGIVKTSKRQPPYLLCVSDFQCPSPSVPFSSILLYSMLRRHCVFLLCLENTCRAATGVCLPAKFCNSNGYLSASATLTCDAGVFVASFHVSRSYICIIARCSVQRI